MDKYSQKQAIDRSWEKDGHIPQVKKVFNGYIPFVLNSRIINETKNVMAKKLVYEMNYCYNVQATVTLGYN